MELIMLLTYEQQNSIADLRQQAIETHSKQNEQELTVEPVGVKIILDAILRGSTASLRSGLDLYHRFGKDDQDWLPVVSAANLALILWDEFETAHGVGSLLDIDRELEIWPREHIGDVRITNARLLIKLRGRTYRDAAVSFTRWLHRDTHRQLAD